MVLDVARVHGVDRLDQVDPGYAITADDLDAAAELAKVTVEPGDVLLCAPARCATTWPASA